jgi:hypothetical protein
MVSAADRGDVLLLTEEGFFRAMAWLLEAEEKMTSSPGYRFTAYRIEHPGEWSFIERGFIYHRIDLSDLGEPYLSAVKESLDRDETGDE